MDMIALPTHTPMYHMCLKARKGYQIPHNPGIVNCCELLWLLGIERGSCVRTTRC